MANFDIIFEISQVLGHRSPSKFVSRPKAYQFEKAGKNASVTFSVILFTDRQTDRQTDKATNELRQKHNLLGGGKEVHTAGIISTM